MELECGIVILPPADLAEAMRRQQAAFNPEYVPAYPPHLTLKGLFSCRSDSRVVRRAVARVCAGSSPVPVSVRGLGCFCAPDGNVIYLAVAASPELRRLHLALVSALEPLTTLVDEATADYEGSRYMPHLTLLGDVPETALAGVRASLASFNPSFDFRADAVSLICHQPDQPWLAPEVFPLGRQVPAR